jgi:hypothetical protein
MMSSRFTGETSLRNNDSPLRSIWFWVRSSALLAHGASDGVRPFILRPWCGRLVLWVPSQVSSAAWISARATLAVARP